jgi:hypothetical protein
VVEHIVNSDWKYGLSVWVNRDKTKDFTVNTAGTGANLFTVWGNGVVNESFTDCSINPWVFSSKR